MIKIIVRLVLFFGLFLFLLMGICGCKPESLSKEKEISICSWNLQTFFDDKTDGREYKEFKAFSWNENAFQNRLKRFEESFNYIDSDIMVLTEVENENVMRALINVLPYKCRYKYAAFAKEEDGVFGCGILSMYPITNVCVSQIQIYGEFSSCHVFFPELRPILKVELAVDDKYVVLVACHWKSKSSDIILKDGQSLSSSIRLLQEHILSDKVLESVLNDDVKAVIAAGDFNQDITEFKKVDVGYRFEGFEKDLIARSCWQLSNEGEERGSYCYRKKWEKIDNFFIFENKGYFSEFKIINDNFFCNKEMEPFRYTVYSDKGISDHFPIWCKVLFE